MFEEYWRDAIRHYGFAVKLARRHVRKSHGFDVNDLVHEGLIVLFEASRKHGPLAPAYAKTCLRHGLCQAIMERGRTIRVPFGSFKNNVIGTQSTASARFWGSTHLLILADQLILNADPTIRLEEQELIERLINALDMLDARRRSIIFQIYWENKSRSQIARTLGCTKQNISIIAKHALDDIRLLVTRED